MFLLNMQSSFGRYLLQDVLYIQVHGQPVYMWRLGELTRGLSSAKGFMFTFEYSYYRELFYFMISNQ